MLDKTITSALCQLRLQLIRSGQPTDHVDALLVQRGVDPEGLHVPRKRRHDACKAKQMRLLLVGEMRTGPKTSGQFVEAFQRMRPDLPLEAARKRVWNAIHKMGLAGMAVRDGRLWRLAQ